MAFEVTIPRLGWSMEKGTFVEWRKKDGDEVRPGEFLYVIEGDKAEQEVEALEGGTLRILKDGPGPGQEVPVGLVIGYLLAPGEQMPARSLSAPISPGAAAVPVDARAAGGETSTAPASRPTPRVSARPALSPSSRRLAASPRARRAASELGVDWHGIKGSGKTGRVVEKDVRDAARAMHGPRGAAAARATLTVGVDSTELAAIGRRFSGNSLLGGTVPSLEALLAKLVAGAFAAHPEREAIAPGRHVDVACAVESPHGPTFVTVGAVDGKSASVIAAELEASAAPATSVMPPLATSPAVLAVANLGSYGVDTYAPSRRIAWPLLLTLGRMDERGTAVLALSFDESTVSFKQAAQLLDLARSAIEQPLLWLAM